MRAMVLRRQGEPLQPEERDLPPPGPGRQVTPPFSGGEAWIRKGEVASWIKSSQGN